MGVTIEILYFDGCPNHEPAQQLVARTVRELGVAATIELVDVPDAASAVEQRFLGSPTIRVNGRDIEAGTHERSDFGLSCRVFQTEAGLQGQPDARWLSEAIERAERAEAVLKAAGISPARRGRARAAELSDGERQLYHGILTTFAATGAAPSGEALRSHAVDLGLEVDAALAALAREDVVHLDDAGEVAVAYPYSGTTTRHKVVIDGGVEVAAMCAIDALGIAPMIRRSVEISSTDPVTGDPVTVRCSSDLELAYQPEFAAVVAGSIACGGGPSYCACCDALNFFASSDSAERYLREHPEVTGFVTTVADAAEAGRVVFEDALDRPEPGSEALRDEAWQPLHSSLSERGRAEYDRLMAQDIPAPPAI